MADVRQKVLKCKKYLESDLDDAKVLYVLKKLSQLAVSIDVLQNTGIGKVVNSFRKRDGYISEKAREIVANWKSMVAAEALRLQEEESDHSSANDNSQSDSEADKSTNGNSPPGSEAEESANENSPSEDGGSPSAHQVMSHSSDDNDSAHAENDSDAEELHSYRYENKHSSQSSKKWEKAQRKQATSVSPVSSHKTSHGKLEKQKHTSADSSKHRESSRGDSQHRTSSNGSQHRTSGSGSKHRTSSSEAGHKMSSNSCHGDSASVVHADKPRSHSSKHHSGQSEQDREKSRSKSDKQQSSRSDAKGSKSGKHDASKSDDLNKSDRHERREQERSHVDKPRSELKEAVSAGKDASRRDREKQHGSHKSSCLEANPAVGSDGDRSRSNKHDTSRSRSDKHDKHRVKSEKHGSREMEATGDRKKVQKKEEKCDTEQESEMAKPKTATHSDKRDKYRSSTSRERDWSSSSEASSKHSHHINSDKQKHLPSQHKASPSSDKHSVAPEKHKHSSNTDKQKQSSSTDKHKQSSNADTHKHSSTDKHKQSSSTDKHKQSSSTDKHKQSSSADMHKHSSTDKHKQSSSTDKQKESSSADKNKELSSSDKHRHSTSLDKESIRLDKHVHSASSDKHLHSTSAEKHKLSTSTDKHKHSSTSDKHKHSSSSDKHNHSSSSDTHKRSSTSDRSKTVTELENKHAAKPSSKHDAATADSTKRSKSKHSKTHKSGSGKSHKKSTTEMDSKVNDSFGDLLSFDNDDATVTKVTADKKYQNIRGKFKVKKLSESNTLGLGGVVAPAPGSGVKRKAEAGVTGASSQSKQIKLSEPDIQSYLPDTQAHYRPWRYGDVNDKKREDMSEMPEIGTKTHSRTQVYSGRKHTTVPEMLSLQDICLRVLQENIDSLDYVGGVPLYILKSVLEKCTAKQLYNLEDYNPHFLEDSDYLWKIHCDNEFRGTEPDEMETWRELYLRKFDEREVKFNSIKANISKSMAKAEPVRKTMMAFVDDGVVKPPRDVRRSQMKYGTGTVRGSKTNAVASKSGKSKPFFSAFDPIAIGRAKQQMMERARKAPMMQKTMQLAKGVTGSRR